VTLVQLNKKLAEERRKFVYILVTPGQKFNGVFRSLQAIQDRFFEVGLFVSFKKKTERTCLILNRGEPCGFVRRERLQ
jgi:hypothetical protein